MSTAAQDREFKKAIVMDKLPDSLLEEAIAWIAKNLQPDDVFADHELGLWAEENGYEKSE